MHTPRKFPRFPVSGSATVKVSENEIAFQGAIERLSQGGVGICAEVNVKTGTPVTLEINVCTESGSPEASITGVIKSFSNWGDKRLIGIQFDRKIDSENEPQIYQLLSVLEKELITDYRRPG